MMLKFHKWIPCLLTFSLVMQSAQCQEIQDVYVDNDCAYAYCAGAEAAHWSAYVPIGVLIVAAIWLGFADQKHGNSSRCSSSSSSYSHSDSSCSYSGSSSSYSSPYSGYSSSYSCYSIPYSSYSGSTYSYSSYSSSSTSSSRRFSYSTRPHACQAGYSH